MLIKTAKAVSAIACFGAGVALLTAKQAHVLACESEGSSQWIAKYKNSVAEYEQKLSEVSTASAINERLSYIPIPAMNRDASSDMWWRETVLRDELRIVAKVHVIGGTQNELEINDVGTCLAHLSKYVWMWQAFGKTLAWGIR